MATVKIKGMSCQHCVKSVTKILSDLDGVQNVEVDLAKGEARFDEAKPVDMSVLKDRITKAGYEIG